MACVAISRKDKATLRIHKSGKKTVRAASIRVGELASARSLFGDTTAARGTAVPWAEVNPTSTFICSPTFPGNPNIYNSIAPNIRVRDIIPRVRRSYEARVLPDYFNRASHFQHLRPL